MRTIFLAVHVHAAAVDKLPQRDGRAAQEVVLVDVTIPDFDGDKLSVLAQDDGQHVVLLRGPGRLPSLAILRAADDAFRPRRRLIVAVAVALGAAAAAAASGNVLGHATVDPAVWIDPVRVRLSNLLRGLFAEAHLTEQHALAPVGAGRSLLELERRGRAVLWHIRRHGVRHRHRPRPRGSDEPAGDRPAVSVLWGSSDSQENHPRARVTVQPPRHVRMAPPLVHTTANRFVPGICRPARRRYTSGPP